MAKKRTTQEKIDALKARADVGAEMKQFVENPAIDLFFSKLTKDATRKLTDLPLEDDKGRLVAATTIQVMRKLQNYMRVMHRLGERAEGSYAELMAQEAERLGDSEDVS